MRRQARLPMTPPSPLPRTRREARRRDRRRRERRHCGIAGAITALSSAATGAPTPPNDAQQLQAYIDENAQTLVVSSAAASTIVVRDEFSATPSFAELAEGGTNHDWAKLALAKAGFPLSENNVTVFTRWMRQENGPDDWW